MSRRRLELVVPGSPAERAIAFAQAYLKAPAGTDVTFLKGRSTKGEPIVGIDFMGVVHAFTAPDARILAGVLEQTMRALPNNAAVSILPDVIMALRHSADVAEGKATNEAH